MRVSVVVPAVDEESSIATTLTALSELNPFEIIVADGGSTDRTVEIARQYARVIHAPKGRGVQQAAGASTACGDVLWFLHADSVPGRDALKGMAHVLDDSRVAGGNFSLRFDGEQRSAGQLTSIYPFLRLLGLCYGDSGIFVRRGVYTSTGGFRPYPLFEDVDLVRRIRTFGRFETVPQEVVTSSRRFAHRRFGVVFAEWTALQLLYWAGVPPHRLAALYPPVRRRR
jgi:rSAM/selenodomain-associated transferase 2